jgi:hypothetical protein
MTLSLVCEQIAFAPPRAAIVAVSSPVAMDPAAAHAREVGIASDERTTVKIDAHAEAVRAIFAMEVAKVSAMLE